AITVHDTTPDGALFLVAKDDGTAASTVAQLNAVLTLLGQGKIEVVTTTVDGVSVTSVTIPDPSALIPSSDLQGLSLPSTPVSFAVAAKGKVIILAAGSPEMQAILDVAALHPLAAAPGPADDPASQLAGQRGLPNSRTTLYVAARAGIALVQRLVPPGDLTFSSSDVMPYLAPIQSVSSTATDDATTSRSRL